MRSRTLILGNLDVLARQEALMSVSVHRNPDLVPGRTTAAPFVYTTPPVTFPAPLPRRWPTAGSCASTSWRPAVR